MRSSASSNDENAARQDKYGGEGPKPWLAIDGRHITADEMTFVPNGPANTTLLRATSRIAYPKLALEGDVQFSSPSGSFTSAILESAHDVKIFQLRCADRTGDLHALFGGRWGHVAPELTAAAPDGSWTLTRGYITGYRSSAAEGNTATVAFRDYEEVHREGPAAVSVVVYAGAPTTGIGWPTHLRELASPDREGLCLGLRCRLFGRDALIRAVEIPELAPYGGTIAIAWVGGGFRGSALRVLITVLSFVFGTFLEQVMRQSIDATGDLLRQTIYPVHSDTTVKPEPPIHLYQPWALAEIGEQLGTMFSRCRSLFVRKVPLDVAVGHLLPPHDGLGGEIRDIALALDTLVESPAFAPQRRLIVQRRRFKAVRSELEAFASTILGEAETELKSRIGQVLQLANTASVNDRRKMFWSSLGIVPSPQELKAMEHRDTMSHLGYIPFQHGREDSWNRLVREMHLLRTLVNRVVFRMLGYEGSVLNYVSGDDTTVAGGRVRYRAKRTRVAQSGKS